MNFLELCQRLRQETGIADSGPAQVTGNTGDLKRIVDWVNEAWMRLQSRHTDWSWMWTTNTINVLNGTAVYSLPATMKEIIDSTVYLDGIKLSPMDYEVYRDLYQTVPSGTPQIFTIRPDGKLVFDRVPDAPGTLSFEGYLKPSHFTDGINVPLMDEAFHMVIVWSALKEYALFDEAPELLTKAERNYADLYSELSRLTLPEISFSGPVA